MADLVATCYGGRNRLVAEAFTKAWLVSLLSSVHTSRTCMISAHILLISVRTCCLGVQPECDMVAHVLLHGRCAGWVECSSRPIRYGLCSRKQHLKPCGLCSACRPELPKLLARLRPSCWAGRGSRASSHARRCLTSSRPRAGSRYGAGCKEGHLADPGRALSSTASKWFVQSIQYVPEYPGAPPLPLCRTSLLSVQLCGRY